MNLFISETDFNEIRAYLFKDRREAMILGACAMKSTASYEISHLFYPLELDYQIRTKKALSLKAESAYPILLMLRQDSLSFLQIHSHPGMGPANFSKVDNINNDFNILDIKDFNSNAQFFRLLFTEDNFNGEFYNNNEKVFMNMDILTYKPSKAIASKNDVAKNNLSL